MSLDDETREKMGKNEKKERREERSSRCLRQVLIPEFNDVQNSQTCICPHLLILQERACSRVDIPLSGMGFIMEDRQTDPNVRIAREPAVHPIETLISYLLAINAASTLS